MPEQNEKIAALEAANLQYQSRVVQPAFFDRLAERGYAPADEKQAQMLLHMGIDLVQRDQRHRAKAAAQHAPRVNQAYAEYCRVAGLEPIVSPGDDDAEKVARAVLADPDAVSVASTLLDALIALDQEG